MADEVEEAGAAFVSEVAAKMMSVAREKGAREKGTFCLANSLTS